MRKVMSTKNKYKAINISILVIIVSLLVFSYIYKESKVQSILEDDLNLNNVQFGLINKHYEVISKNINKFIINDKKIIDIFKQVKDADKSTQNKLRKKLYAQLKHKYDSLKEQGFRQIHFHLPNNTSFLRMHKPKKFGDDLTDVRYSIKRTNLTLEPISGFEEGRIVNGFRFVFPMFDERKEHIGSVEVSISSAGYINMFQNYFSSDINFLIKKSVVDKKVFADELSKHYVESTESSDYYREIISNYSNQNIDEKFIADVKKGMKNGNAFAVYAGANKIVSFLPIKNIQDKKTIAYFSICIDSMHIKHILAVYFIVNIIIFFVFGMLLYFNFKEYKYRKNIDSMSGDVQKYSTELELRFNEQTKTNKELKRQEVYLQKSQEIAHIGVWEFDMIRDTLYWSDEVYKIFAVDKSTFKPDYSKLLQRVHPEDIDKLDTEYVNSIEEKREYYLEHRIVKPDGSISYVEERGNHTFDDNGKLLSTLGIILDITAKKELELSLIELNKDLDSRVKDEVAKNKLKEQQLFAQSRLAQMGEMISMIAHQWRQPLSAISSTAVNLKTKLLLDSFKLDTPESRLECNTYFEKRLGNIENFVQTLTTTIDDFRNFYKPNKKYITTTFKDIVEKALDIIKASLLNHNIEIIYEYNSDKELDLYGNEMMQVILNILKNAQDNFIEKNIENAKIIITIEDSSISISDNGGGIPEAIIDNIFDPYFSTKDEKNGTGLGLYMSKTIVQEHHKGTLHVENTDDGVCFKIEL
ncbi:MAG: hypothetical protein DRG78_05560 [Epsilonproteobacteria bacterium]|nr:MAG: hypothetical protein DRG78_05560 [Campylobacterota bacterium]